MFKNFTDTEVLKKIDDTVRDHEIKKKQIIDLSYEIDKLSNELGDLEEQYIALIAELNNRKENGLR